MCLEIADPLIREAEEDIKVYKILVRSDGILWSPYFGGSWYKGQTKTLSHFSESKDTLNMNPIREFVPLHVSKIGYGLHSFARLDVAEAAMEVFNGTVLANFVIPKGTKFIVGQNGDLVSLALTFVSIIMDTEEVPTFKY